MINPKKILLARTTVLTLIVMTLGVMLVGSFIPQKFLLTPKGAAKWHADYPILAPLAEQLGLQQIYTHPLFAGIIMFASVSLLFSCVEQCRISWRRTFANNLQTGDVSEFASAAGPAKVTDWLRQRGYIRVASGAGTVRLCRNPWGFWGNALLHVGMLIVIVSSLWIALTQQRGLVHLAVGELFSPGDKWFTTEKGLLADDFRLDRPVRLDGITYEFWPTYGVKNIASMLTFSGSGQMSETRTVEINNILHVEGVRIYQAADFGHAFYLEIVAPAGERKIYQLLIAHQEKPDKPSYEDFPDIFGPGRALRAKYYADADKRSLTRENPLLVLRLDDNGRQLGQLPLITGGAGAIDQYHFRLLKVDRWSGLIFVRLFGISGVFFGFLVIICGSALNYFTPPREVTVRLLPGGDSLVSWRAVKFSEFYQDEFAALNAAFNRGGDDG